MRVREYIYAVLPRDSMRVREYICSVTWRLHEGKGIYMQSYLKTS